jgi:hypothetical protein
MKTSILHAVLAGCMLLLPALAYAQEQPPQNPPTQPSATAPTTTAPPPTTTTAPPAPPPNGNQSAQPPSQPAQPPVESKVKPLPPAPPAEKKITTPIIVAGALGGAALINGTVFAIMALGDKSSYDETPNHKVGISGERNSFIADVSFALGALFGLTAVAMYFLPDEPAPPPTGGGGGGDQKKATTPSKTSLLKSALTGEVFRF